MRSKNFFPILFLTKSLVIVLRDSIMEINREVVNQKKFKITKSGTFTTDKEELIKSKQFEELVKTLKPVSQLNKK